MKLLTSTRFCYQILGVWKTGNEFNSGRYDEVNAAERQFARLKENAAVTELRLQTFKIETVLHSEEVWTQ
jgi:hypothetical protein